ncbi:MAG: uridine kinase [Ktedonobacteraceae bacterium]
MTRGIVLSQLADTMVSLQHSHPLRVAIDGIDASGKTTLADQLVPVIERRGRPVIRASIDGFHRPRSQRYQRGPDSPAGYYEDSFDYPSLQSALLYPLGPQGSRRYRRAIFDVRHDVPLVTKEEQAPPNAILLFDGVFLLRPELNALWDYRIFIHVDFEVALQRAMVRDQALFGLPEAVQARYLQRYIPGQRLYFQIAHPQTRADVIVDNNDPAEPQLIFSH